MKIVLATVAATALFAATGAQAADNTVTFTGTLVNSCILNLSTPGLLAAGSDGTSLSSESVGGLSAVMAVTAIGTKPTLTFAAPSLTAPNGIEGSPVTSIRWNSLSGKAQAYTSGASTATGVSLIDTFTVNSKVENTAGFPSGNYTVRTVVTCQQ
jgi:hypothetical protein